MVLNKAPAYLLGERTSQNSLVVKTGTTQAIGPGAYKLGRTLAENDSPKWGLGYGERSKLSKPQTLVDEYFVYELIFVNLVPLANKVNQDINLCL